MLQCHFFCCYVELGLGFFCAFAEHKLMASGPLTYKRHLDVQLFYLLNFDITFNFSVGRDVL